MLNDILQELNAPADIISLTDNISVPSIPDICLDMQTKEKSDIFKAEKHKSWDKTEEARCDFTYKLRLTPRASLLFTSIWQKSVYGRTLTDIKADDAMIPFFAENIAPIILGCLGDNLHNGSWAIVTTPMRRHRDRNFASLISERIAALLDIPFYFDCAHCNSRHRVGAVFEPHNIPKERNIIVFDDFVTTGSTMLSMRNMLQSFGKNCTFFAGINNKL